jgi:hypothetical protein
VRFIFRRLKGKPLMCLDFCITLLDHRITHREYNSPLAVLGVKEDGEKDPEQYLLILSAVMLDRIFIDECHIVLNWHVRG